MADFDALDRSLALLRNSVSNFPIGALTPEDLKPIQEKIKDLRVTLRCLKSRIQMLKVETNLQSIPRDPESDYNKLVGKLRNKISETIITNQITSICLQSQATQAILSDDKVDPEMRSKVKSLLVDLYTLNDLTNARHELLDGKLLKKQLQLKQEYVKELSDLSDFLKEQEKVRNRELEQSNPEIAQKKQKVRKLLNKINLMKRLITNFISAASPVFEGQPEMVEFLRSHRDLVTMEIVMKQSENSSDDSRDS